MTAPGTTRVRLTVNGRSVEVETDGRRRLVDVLREDLGLTGTKVGCNAGDCGACTVRLDGRQVCACMVAAAQVQDRTVVTVEGLKNGAGASAIRTRTGLRANITMLARTIVSRLWVMKIRP